MDYYSDADWAGCPLTRRSSSGAAGLYGQHCVAFAASTQIPIALSSGESEFYGCAKCASRLLGYGGLLSDLGEEHELRLFPDSSSARGILARRGVGRVRHLETPTLWVQRAVELKRFSVCTVPGKSNPGDLGTKYLDQQTLLRHLKFLCLHVRAAF